MYQSTSGAWPCLCHRSALRESCFTLQVAGARVARGRQVAHSGTPRSVVPARLYPASRERVSEVQRWAWLSLDIHPTSMLRLQLKRCRWVLKQKRFTSWSILHLVFCSCISTGGWLLRCNDEIRLRKKRHLQQEFLPMLARGPTCCINRVLFVDAVSIGYDLRGASTYQRLEALRLHNHAGSS